MVIAGDLIVNIVLDQDFLLLSCSLLLLISWLALTKKDSHVAVSHTAVIMALIGHGLIMYSLVIQLMALRVL